MYTNRAIGKDIFEARCEDRDQQSDYYDNAKIFLKRTAALVSTSRSSDDDDWHNVTLSLNMEARASLTFKLSMEELLIREHGLYHHRFQIIWNPSPSQRPYTVHPQVRVNIFEVLPLSDVKVNLMGSELSKITHFIELIHR